MGQKQASIIIIIIITLVVMCYLACAAISWHQIFYVSLELFSVNIFFWFSGQSRQFVDAYQSGTFATAVHDTDDGDQLLWVQLYYIYYDLVSQNLIGLKGFER